MVPMNVEKQSSQPIITNSCLTPDALSDRPSLQSGNGSVDLCTTRQGMKGKRGVGWVSGLAVQHVRG